MAIRNLTGGELDQVAGGFDIEALNNRPTCTIPNMQGKLQVLSRELLEPYINDPREAIEPEFNTPHGYPFTWQHLRPRPSVTPPRLTGRIGLGANRQPDKGNAALADEKRTHQPVTMSWKMPYLNRWSENIIELAGCPADRWIWLSWPYPHNRRDGGLELKRKPPSLLNLEK